MEATRDIPATVEVIVNGNQELADKMRVIAHGLHLSSSASKIVRIWFLSAADKARAWNSYVHKIWSGSDVAFFVDGYTRVSRDSFAQLVDGLISTPEALGATGVPTMGRSARKLRGKMIRAGGIHGNLYALRGEVVKQLRDRKFLFPLGLYRTDALIGAVVCFGLDPATNEWDTRRIFVQPQATWEFEALRWWRVKDLWSYWKRALRQAQGVLENHAVREHMAIQKRPPEMLPNTASTLVVEWLNAFPKRARTLFFLNPLCFIAARKLRNSISLPAPVEPVLIDRIEL